MANQKPGLNMTTLENWLWEAACKIRGEVDAPKYKDYILPIIFLKRLSDVFEDEAQKLAESNLSNLAPHPFYVFLNYSHPPLLQRVHAIQQYEAQRSRHEVS